MDDSCHALSTGVPFSSMANRYNAICRKQILNIFETCVVSEIVKSLRNSGKRIEYNTGTWIRKKYSVYQGSDNLPD